jgi:hypothetical protein
MITALTTGPEINGEMPLNNWKTMQIAKSTPVNVIVFVFTDLFIIFPLSFKSDVPVYDWYIIILFR